MATDEYCMRILYYTTSAVRNIWGRASSTRFIFSSSPPKQPRYRSDIPLLLYRPSICDSTKKGGGSYRFFLTPSLLGARARVTYPRRGEIMGYDVNLRSLKFMQMTRRSPFLVFAFAITILSFSSD